MKSGERKPIKINKEAYDLLMREKRSRGARSISEVITNLFEGRKEPDKEQILRALKEAEKLIAKKSYS